uniref:growth arrest-specific protein 2-like n=1 Tax=Ciona intestinalis TaxID=7719 RepID=UPI000EF4B1B2|nr:growth arrest-specific protein 2-like [Ciona intestinalis]|eukprot:XP_026692319.1 growth arrest-specific protein 2-like [Ciona intestinalis]
MKKYILLYLLIDVYIYYSIFSDKQFNAENLFETLQTGSLLCQLAAFIHKFAAERNVRPKSAKHRSGEGPISAQLALRGHSLPIPEPPLFRASAQPGSFLARDNASNFIDWCKRLGVDDSCLFKSEGLVLQKQPRNVVLCLLDVARKAARHGIPPPELIKLEDEIDRQEVMRDEQEVMSSISINLNKRAKVLKLDDAVHAVVDGQPFNGQVNIKRIGEGRYKIDGKIVFIRMLHGKHVMVRVGGGWDTLEHYIVSHDQSRHFGGDVNSNPRPKSAKPRRGVSPGLKINSGLLNPVPSKFGRK